MSSAKAYSYLDFFIVHNILGPMEISTFWFADTSCLGYFCCEAWKHVAMIQFQISVFDYRAVSLSVSGIQAAKKEMMSEHGSE
jgi:hypothetical protein